MELVIPKHHLGHFGACLFVLKQVTKEICETPDKGKTTLLDFSCFINF